jgi:hypothetical protein
MIRRVGDGPVGSLICIEATPATDRVKARRLSCGHGCASSPRPGSDTDIDACTSCCGARAGSLGKTKRIGSTPQRRGSYAVSDRDVERCASVVERVTFQKRANQAWCLNFVADQLVDGTRIRILTIVDVFTRDGVAIEVGHRLRGGCGQTLQLVR